MSIFAAETETLKKKNVTFKPRALLFMAIFMLSEECTIRSMFNFHSALRQTSTLEHV